MTYVHGMAAAVFPLFFYLILAPPIVMIEEGHIQHFRVSSADFKARQNPNNDVGICFQ